MSIDTSLYGTKNAEPHTPLVVSQESMNWCSGSREEEGGRLPPFVPLELSAWGADNPLYPPPC